MTTPLRVTTESIRLIRCRVKDDSSGGFPFHELCGGPTLAEAVACAQRNLHHNYVDIYLEICVEELDVVAPVRRISTRFVHLLTLDRALSPDAHYEELSLLTERVLSYQCVANDDTVQLETWDAVCDWYRRNGAHPYVQVVAIISVKRDHYNREGAIGFQTGSVRWVTVLERDLCQSLATLSL